MLICEKEKERKGSIFQFSYFRQIHHKALVLKMSVVNVFVQKQRLKMEQKAEMYTLVPMLIQICGRFTLILHRRLW